MPSSHPCLEVFVRCADAIRANKLIRRESKQDKEFHFQNWFKALLGETALNFEVGRNTYPDFRRRIIRIDHFFRLQLTVTYL